MLTAIVAFAFVSTLSSEISETDVTIISTPVVLPLLSGNIATTPPFLPPFTAVPNGGYNEGICRDESAIM